MQKNTVKRLEKELDIRKEFSDSLSENILSIATRAEGIANSFGVHAAGVIIGDGQPLKEIIPLLYNTKKAQWVIQCDMNKGERMGCLKMDFLGLKNLDIMTNSIRLIYKRKGISIDLSNLPFEDVVFKEIFAKGNTGCVFQFESGGMKQMLVKFGPESFEDIILLVASYRPGPMQYIPDMIEIKHKRKKAEYIIPQLEDILGKTYGQCIYQEQLMDIFHKCAGFSLGKADLIRRFMSKKKEELFLKEKEPFLEGIIKKGASRKDAEKYWNELVEFAKYAFNKSHAAAYAVISYQTAYLKYHYPIEYSSSSMQKEALVKEKIQEDVKTLNRKGLDSKENKRFQESIGEKRETTSDILGMHSKNREARDYLKSDDMDMSVRKSQQRKIDRIVERDMGNIRDAAKVITVYSAKGGVGKTTLSCELATYLALTSNGRNRYKVCIADFNIDFGDVKNTLNFDPNKACMSVWAEDIRERVNAGQRPETICYSEAEISKYLQVDKSSNLYALLAPFTNEDSMDINTYELEVIMRNLRENGGFDFIVCDTGNNTRDSSFIALENADIIIMVLTQCMNTALCNYGLLNTLYQLNSFDLNRIKLVINKEQSSRAVGISVEELVEADAFRNPETKKPYELLGTIKNSNKVKLAGNMGSPLVYDVASEFTKEIGVIASKIIGKSYVLPEMKKKGFFARLFGRK